MLTITKQGQEFILKDTHRGLWYEDGKLTKVLEAGRYEIPASRRWFRRRPIVECVLVDIRERDLTIKGLEILTADKVAIRVSILVQFRVMDANSAVQTVENYEERLYSDVQLAARRSLASMNLEEILTNRNRLSEDILGEVKEAAAGYGVPEQQDRDRCDDADLPGGPVGPGTGQTGREIRPDDARHRNRCHRSFAGNGGTWTREAKHVRGLRETDPAPG